MCGELDEDVHIDNEVFERFLMTVRRQGIAAPGKAGSVPDLEEPSGRSAYMEALFSAGLARAVGDAEAAAEGQRIDAIACQAIAFARVAGFLAGQLPPEADLFRSAVEALTDGHAMPGRIREEVRRASGHHHHHHGSHGHDHEH